MSELVIVLDRLSKSFGNVHAVQDLSLEIEAGSIFGFLGPNGAGKTTTMRMLCGLTHPTGGHATIEGADVWKDRQRVRTKFGYVPQRFSLYSDLTVVENFRFFGGAYGVPSAELERRIDHLLRVIDLEEKKNTAAQSLSGGMRQLLAIGCALVHNPSLLFFDEPTAGLDPVHRQQIWDLLYDLSNEGKTIFVTTHYMDEAERCTEVGFMKWLSLEAVASVAYKEFLHIYRDRRVLLLVLTLPPLFTLLFGHAFETGELTGVPSLLIDRDNTPRAQEFIDIISKNKTFQWKRGSPDTSSESDLLAYGVKAALVIPAAWNESLENGDPKPLLLYLDASDINTDDAVEGSVRQSLGDFQLKQRDRMIETLPEEVIDVGKQLPVQIRKRFV